MRSDFYDLMQEGMENMLEQMSDADGNAIKIAYDGKSAAVIPGSQQQINELRRNGLWKSGMILVELLRSEVLRLKLDDRSIVEYGAAAAKMKVKVFDEDPADPAVRLTMMPYNG